MAHQRQVRINHGLVDPLTPRERQHIVGRYNRTILDRAFGRHKTDVVVIALDDLDLMGINDFNALLGLGGRQSLPYCCSPSPPPRHGAALTAHLSWGLAGRRGFPSLTSRPVVAPPTYSSPIVSAPCWCRSRVADYAEACQPLSFWHWPLNLLPARYAYNSCCISWVP